VRERAHPSQSGGSRPFDEGRHECPADAARSSGWIHHQRPYFSDGRCERREFGAPDDTSTHDSDDEAAGVLLELVECARQEMALSRVCGD
jgi:hypothetical protein